MSNQDKLACCAICTLATAMKDCAKCPFFYANLKLSPTEKQALPALPVKSNSK